MDYLPFFSLFFDTTENGLGAELNETDHHAVVNLTERALVVGVLVVGVLVVGVIIATRIFSMQQ